MSNHAAAFPVTPTPEPPPQVLIDAVASSVADNTGEGVSAVANDNALTWVGEDANVLGQGQAIRYRLYSYQFAEDVPACGAYSIEASMEVTSDGPDIGLNDNIFFAVLDDNEGFGVLTSQSPVSIGQSLPLELTVPSSAAGIAGGVIILYGATTFQSPDISSGYSFGPPTVEVLSDFSACPGGSAAEAVPTTGRLHLLALCAGLALAVALRRRRSRSKRAS